MARSKKVWRAADGQLAKVHNLRSCTKVVLPECGAKRRATVPKSKTRAAGGGKTKAAREEEEGEAPGAAFKRAVRGKSWAHDTRVKWSGGAMDALHSAFGEEAADTLGAAAAAAAQDRHPLRGARPTVMKKDLELRSKIKKVDLNSGPGGAWSTLNPHAYAWWC